MSSLTGSVVQAQVLNLSLTSTGTTDWAVWGYSAGGTSISLVPDVRKAGGSSISSLTEVKNGSIFGDNPLRGLGQFGNYGESTFNWTDGTTPPSATGAFTGLQHDAEITRPTQKGVGEGFSFVVPSSNSTVQEVKIYLTSLECTSTVVATLTNGSVLPLSFTASAAANIPAIVTLDFSSALAGQTLTISATDTAQSALAVASNSDNIAIQAVTLSAVSVPEPTAVAALAIGSVGLMLNRRRTRVA